MSHYPNRQSALPRHGQTHVPVRRAVSQRSGNPVVATLIGVCVIAGAFGILWALKDRDRKREAESKVAAMLRSTDPLIEGGQDSQAESLMRQALGILPGDPRCQAVLDRIAAKREMYQKKLKNDSTYALAQAEQVALGDIPASLEAYERIRQDKSLSEEARRTAADRIATLKTGVCTLRLPADWPPEAMVSIDGVESKSPANGTISGIVPGRRRITVSRFGYREPAPLELDFRGLETMKYPAVNWKVVGGKVKLVSQPAGAQVWQNGTDLGKVTPCELEDVDAGEVEFILKHPDHANTPVKGEVKSRQSTRLSVSLAPKDG